MRPIETFLVWGRNADRTAACVSDIARRTGLAARACGLEDAVRSADVIVTTTPSTEPLVEAAWLSLGQHIRAMGVDAEAKTEIEPDVLLRADRLVVENRAQCASWTNCIMRCGAARSRTMWRPSISGRSSLAMRQDAGTATISRSAT